jgi:hypothetical protein
MADSILFRYHMREGRNKELLGSKERRLVWKFKKGVEMKSFQYHLSNIVFEGF